MHNVYAKYKDKYRTTSIRLKHYDYSQDGAYFITICTKDRNHFFGNILNDKIKYSTIGEIAKDCWLDLPNHFQFIELGEWIIMPNHMHGIIFIYKTKEETLHATSLQEMHLDRSQAVIAPKKYSLSSIIRSYKSAVSKKSRGIEASFSWQPRFYERVIRNEHELCKVSEYIIANPLNWLTDDYYSNCA